MIKLHHGVKQQLTPTPKPWLFISGVDISKDIQPSGDDDLVPDYIVLRNALEPDILDMHVIDGVHHVFVKLVRKMFGAYWAIAVAALLQSYRHHIIFATGEDVGLRLAFLAKIVRNRVPIVLTCHNIASPGRVFFFQKLGVGSIIRTFLCLSHAQSAMLMTRYAIEQERLKVIGWFVDHTFFKPMHSAPLRHQICSAGMASRDYATLIEATRTIAIDVKIAADSPWFQQALNITPETLPPRVEVKSYGTYQALRQLYAESLFVVVPLHDVEFSAGYSVILEAMAMGKCVIVSRIKQQDDFIIDGWNGFHVTPGNVAELQDRIMYLLKHAEEAQRLGANGRRLIEERYTLAHYVTHVQQTFDEVLDQSKEQSR